jgi:hypothetical protein
LLTVLPQTPSSTDRPYAAEEVAVSEELISIPRSGLLPFREAAAYLTVTPATLRARTDAGEVACVRISKRNTRWHVDDLDAYIARLRAESAGRAR